MRASTFLQNTGSAIWIGGQFFAIVALPAATAVLPRRLDRQRVLRAGWDTWTPLSFAALAATAAGALAEMRDGRFENDRRRASFRLAAALAGLVSTGLATAIGKAMKKAELGAYPVIRSDTGLPVVYVTPRETLRKGMIPVNALHAVSAVGLIAAAR